MSCHFDFDECEEKMVLDGGGEKFGEGAAGNNIIRMTGNNRIATNGGGSRPILMPLEVWTEILGWIKRMEMAEKWSLICHGLHELCWPRLHGDKVGRHLVDKLLFDSNKDRRGATLLLYITNFATKRIPIASTPPPDYILGFRSIHLSYLDQQVLDFMRVIKPLLSNNNLRFSRELDDKHLPKTRQLIQLLEDTAPHNIICRYNTFGKVYRLFPELIESGKMLAADLYSEPFFLSFGAIGKMLDKPHGDGQPRLMMIHDYVLSVNAIIDAIKEKFCQENQCQTFFIAIPHSPFANITTPNAVGEPFNPFEMENPRTGEILSLYRFTNGGKTHYALCRRHHEDIVDAAHWRGEMEKKMWGAIGDDDDGRTRIIVDIAKFGKFS